MAKEIQNKNESKIIKILKTEYKFEGIILGVLGMLVTVLGVYLIQGDEITIKWTDFVLFNEPWKVMTFAIIVTVVGAVSFIMAIFPFFAPSWQERKKISWPKKDVVANHSARVYGFIIFVVLFFILVDWPLRELFGLLAG
jgi:preprotein translocase subunit SecE